MASFERNLGLPMPNFEGQHAKRVFELHDQEHGAIVPLADGHQHLERKLTFKWANLTKHTRITLVMDKLQKEGLVQDSVAWKIIDVTPPNGQAIVLFNGVTDGSTVKAYVELDHQENGLNTNFLAPVWSEKLSALPAVSEFELMETDEGHVKIQKSEVRVGRIDSQGHVKHSGETSVVSHIFS